MNLQNNPSPVDRGEEGEKRVRFAASIYVARTTTLRPRSMTTWKVGARTNVREQEREKNREEEKRKEYVWFGSGRWASNSGHRARMTSNRSRALCQHYVAKSTWWFSSGARGSFCDENRRSIPFSKLSPNERRKKKNVMRKKRWKTHESDGEKIGAIECPTFRKDVSEVVGTKITPRLWNARLSSAPVYRDDNSRRIHDTSRSMTHRELISVKLDISAGGINGIAGNCEEEPHPVAVAQIPEHS